MNKKYLNPQILRSIISALLILSSAAPWKMFYGGVATPTVTNGFSIFSDLLFLISNPEYLDRLLQIWASGLFFFLPLLGQLFVLCYSGLSIYSLIKPKTSDFPIILSKWIILLLIISAIPVSFNIVFQYNSSAGWGAWSMLLSIGLAITIEAINIRHSDKLYNPRST